MTVLLVCNCNTGAMTLTALPKKKLPVLMFKVLFCNDKKGKSTLLLAIPHFILLYCMICCIFHNYAFRPTFIFYFFLQPLYQKVVITPPQNSLKVQIVQKLNTTSAFATLFK